LEYGNEYEYIREPFASVGQTVRIYKDARINQLPASVNTTSQSNLTELFGSTDIYLFDQLLKGVNADMSLLDGCGNGRILFTFCVMVFCRDGSMSEAVVEVKSWR
jgi:hypothetical protein